MDKKVFLGLLQEIEFLKDEILGLPRVLRGALKEGSKKTAYTLVKQFVQQTEKYELDTILTQTIVQLQDTADKIKNGKSDDEGGYIMIETQLNVLMSHIGFIKGYLFLKYDQLFPKTKRQVVEDDDTDEVSAEESDEKSDNSDDEELVKKMENTKIKRNL
jgi:hypothetical protein